MEKKGHEFRGLAGGEHYRRWARWLGMGPEFYRNALGGIGLMEGQKALDLGCGPGALSLALAESSHSHSVIWGIDISNDQLMTARKDAATCRCKMEFHRISMDQLPFDDQSYDLVMSSMAIHETPPAIRRAAIAETSRVLKPDGLFLLVDWSKPRFGGWGILWFPMVRFGQSNRDNWDNVYPELCRGHGLYQIEDRYINSIARRQLFQKKGADR